MPTAPLSYCASTGCSNRVSHGHCPEHAKAKEQQRPNVELRKLYHTAPWIRLAEVVKQEEPLCVECLAETGCSVATVDVHHIQKATRENFLIRSNLRALCKTHHSRHTKRGE